MELSITLESQTPPQLLFGSGDRHLRQIRSALAVQISARDSVVRLAGDPPAVTAAAKVLEALKLRLREHQHIREQDVTELLEQALETRQPTQHPSADHTEDSTIDVYTTHPRIGPKTDGQAAYLQAIHKHDLTICLGPAGTGKTYLAVAMAVTLLKHHRIKRIVLVRPAVEAGEKLGFLPGDMQAKVNPYLRPLFDAMHDMMPFEQLKRFMQNDIIEVIPLAFMRGRTLNHSAVILDEAQNSTVAQMLMFLTRLGHDSKMIVTGDDSQVDLERGQKSGLLDAAQRLGPVPGVAVVRLLKSDIVRHPLVQHIVEVYGENGLNK
ncbi:MAG: PhoH-like protein [Phycisphaerae bacterium]|nr:PhoH-like protein [Phycisphaerae bacterium]